MLILVLLVLACWVLVLVLVLGGPVLVNITVERADHHSGDDLVR